MDKSTESSVNQIIFISRATSTAFVLPFTPSFENPEDGRCIVSVWLRDISRVYGLIMHLRNMNASFTYLKIENADRKNFLS